MAPDPAGRRSSSSSASSTSSTVPPLNIRKINPRGSSPTSSPSASTNNSNVSLPNFSRPAAQIHPPHDALKHRPRQHSQGFFEPSLPTATLSEQHLHLQGQQTPAQLSASRIAAKAAMQHQTASQQNLRNRSSTIPPQDHLPRKVSSPPPLPPTSAPPVPQRNVSTGGHGMLYHNGSVGGRSVAAATAANLVFPRTAPAQPGAAFESHGKPEGKGEKEKEKSKMKLFSKPKHIISRDREKDKDKGTNYLDKPLPSPSKSMLAAPSGLSKMVNASTTSLHETASSSNSSMYNMSNSSVSTVVPTERQPEKDKKHHFLSRPKLKLKDKDKSDHHHLPLSSASSNSRPLDPNAPQSLYSFTPSSPSTTSFSKSMSGLDLRHGGRALREKKKEEKAEKAAAAAAAAAAAVTATEEMNVRDGDQSVFGDTDPNALVASNLQMREVLQGFGLHNMTPEDAWDFLKAKLLVIFEGEDVRIALEDLNKLVSIHVHHCIQKKMPSVIVEDLRDLLHTGFSSINHSLLSVPDDHLVPFLAQTWLFVFGRVLPYIQAVFLPLDQEFKGCGTIMSSHEAAEFWGAMPNGEFSNTAMGDQLDVRDIVLTSFRDTIILNRYNILKTTFSQLSLDKININTYAPSNGGCSTRRPSTSSGPAVSLDPNFNSFNSQSSTVLNTPGSISFSDNIPLITHSARARATSNTSSNPDLPFLQSATANSTYSSSFSPPQSSFLSQAGVARRSPQPQHAQAEIDPSLLITETVGRMFQCISVLCSVVTNDKAQDEVDELRRSIKLNWMGRARTGRDRRGFVGMKVRKDGEGEMEERVDWESERRVSVGGELF